MNCNNCGNPINPGDTVCRNCGNPVGGTNDSNVVASMFDVPAEPTADNNDVNNNQVSNNLGMNTQVEMNQNVMVNGLNNTDNNAPVPVEPIANQTGFEQNNAIGNVSNPSVPNNMSFSTPEPTTQNVVNETIPPQPVVNQNITTTENVGTEVQNGLNVTDQVLMNQPSINNVTNPNQVNMDPGMNSMMNNQMNMNTNIPNQMPMNQAINNNMVNPNQMNMGNQMNNQNMGVTSNNKEKKKSSPLLIILVIILILVLAYAGYYWYNELYGSNSTANSDTSSNSTDTTNSISNDSVIPSVTLNNYRFTIPTGLEYVTNTENFIVNSNDYVVVLRPALTKFSDVKEHIQDLKTVVAQDKVVLDGSDTKTYGDKEYIVFTGKYEDMDVNYFYTSIDNSNIMQGIIFKKMASSFDDVYTDINTLINSATVLEVGSDTTYSVDNLGIKNFNVETIKNKLNVNNNITDDTNSKTTDDDQTLDNSNN